MTTPDRQPFESIWPVPEGVEWSGKMGCYSRRHGPGVGLHDFLAYNAKWKGFQSARTLPQPSKELEQEVIGLVRNERQVFNDEEWRIQCERAEGIGEMFAASRQSRAADEPVAWLIQYNDVRKVFLHNCIADFRVFDRDATSTPLVDAASRQSREGWVSVPREPSEVMCDAGGKAIVLSQEHGTFTCVGHDAMDCYKAMIAASTTGREGE